MSATYRTRINNESITIAVDGARFRYIGDSEQCEDCGRDELRLHRDRAGQVDCLLCNHCETAYPLRLVADA